MVSKRCTGFYCILRKLQPLPEGKPAIEITADYLSYLRRVIAIYLEKISGTPYKKLKPVSHHIFTVPSIWSYSAKNNILKAAISAGFIKDEKSDRISLVAEQKAAATWCISYAIVELSPKNAVLVMDCGGATVKMESYQLGDGKQPILLELYIRFW
jgi:molecular chaperone DnaK (HSP70)